MNTFTLKFFARLRKQTGLEELSIPVERVASLTELKAYLLETYPHWSTFLDAQLMSAVNQTMVTGNATLKAGDEVALFPPVTGG